jgi:hypothetical protein
VKQFLSGLRTAWQEDEVRPTSVPKAKPKRSRRRPDPFVAVITELRGWLVIAEMAAINIKRAVFHGE